MNKWVGVTFPSSVNLTPTPFPHCKSRIIPARDAEGYLRIVDPGLMPIPNDVMEIHEEKLRRRAARGDVPFGLELAVSSVYEMAEPVAKLLPDKWTR